MESKVLTTFSGYINGHHFRLERNFKIAKKVIIQLENKFNDVFVAYIPRSIDSYINRMVKDGIREKIIEGALISFAKSSTSLQDFENRLKSTKEYAKLVS